MLLRKEIQTIIDEMKKIEEIEGILLAGSQAAKTNDVNSDYDFYVYSNVEIPLEKRKQITDQFFSYVELNNTFWETEDDGIVRDGQIEVEFIYRDIQSMDEMINNVVIQHNANVGFTTCFWFNLLNSVIVFDRNGTLTQLQDKYNVSYPQVLKENIVLKNYPLLRNQMPAYYFQIEKALKRNDLISVNHRVAALLASYFDIIFAINEMQHPGEKKLMRLMEEQCTKLPVDMNKNLTSILQLGGTIDFEILNEINVLIDHLDELLTQENLMFDWIKMNH